MLVLCLDTATPDVAAALVDTASGEAWPQVRRDARGAGEHLVPLAVAACADAGRRLQDVQAIAVGLGPGPYTGLRAGVVTGAALGLALGVPAFGACSLDLWAVGSCVVATDARRREVFWARYDDGKRTDGPFVSAPADVPTDLPIVGPGAELCGAEPDQRSASVERLAALVDPASTPEPLVPLYLRKPDAVEPVR